jgi:predicted TIM-barrel fold metal-dependent hydrolase
MSDTRDADLQRASLTRKLTGIIDVHSHIILDLGTGRDAGTGMPIEMMPPWSVESTLSLMDTHGIAACVLSVPEAASYADSAKACEIARRTNEYLAKIVAQHPTRFGAMATESISPAFMRVSRPVVGDTFSLVSSSNRY